ncbi:MAG: bifunctional oligoribonuclease/PAP phosphatase NrnA [Dorea sp.]|jgi:nanoRNase/pAp phosphatase (c-di-AMP/oligoRNAs hydrolase)|nr:bifunctional oligoribonuclease/PAP phosphatase NrnA [Dorea sp.]
MLSRMLKMADTIAIGGHIRPDGDCIGSCMGLSRYIKENYSDKTVDVYLEEIPEKFRFIKETENIRHEVCDEKNYDLFICLDCGDIERLGFSGTLFENAEHTLCIDHHVSNQGFAQENHIVPDASSTSELVYYLLDKERVSVDVAEALYVGIAHDTGVFQYSCTSPSTMRAAAALLETGLNAPKIIRDTYYEKTYAQHQVLGRALLESIMFLDGKCIASYIRAREMRFFDVDRSDLDGIASQMRNTKGVEVAIFMDEIRPNVYKVSLRSGDRVDVSVIAQYFGGGGHKRAAGFTLTGTPYDVINNLSGQIELQLEKEA